MNNERKVKSVPRLGKKLDLVGKLSTMFCRLIVSKNDMLPVWSDDKALSCVLKVVPRPEYTRAMLGTLAQYDTFEKLQIETLRRLAFQFVMRGDELRHGPLLRSDKLVASAWVPLDVESADEQDNTVVLCLRCLAGQLAGLKITRAVPRKWINFFAYKIGFSRRVQFDGEVINMCGLRFYGKVELKGEAHDFTEWEMDSSMRTMNRKILALRYRSFVNTPSDIWQCPHDSDLPSCIGCVHDTRQCVELIELMRKHEKTSLCH